jgi:hypothetical protein
MMLDTCELLGSLLATGKGERCIMAVHNRQEMLGIGRVPHMLQHVRCGFRGVPDSAGEGDCLMENHQLIY